MDSRDEKGKRKRTLRMVMRNNGKRLRKENGRDERWSNKDRG